MPILLGGDFRQIPLVLKRVDVHEFPAHTLKACDWWYPGQNLKRNKLVKNERAEEDLEFADMILQIGDGTYDQTTGEPCAVVVALPEKFLAHPDDEVEQFI